MALKLTEEEIEAGRSLKGGFTRAKLAEWGVPWPAPSGWKEALLAGRSIVPPTVDDPSLIRPKVSAHELLKQVVTSVIEAGHASDLYKYPDVLEYFGARRDAKPTYHDSGLIERAKLPEVKK